MMLRHRISWMFGAVCVLSASLVQASTPKIPLEDFFRKPEFAQLTLSPNGKYLGVVAPIENRMNLVVIDLDTRKSSLLTRVTEQDVSGFAWANDDRLLFFMDKDGNESFGIYAINRDGTKPYTLAPSVETQIQSGRFMVRVTAPLNMLEDDDQHILVTTNERLAAYPDVYRMNLYNGRKRVVERNRGDIVGWGTNHDGEVVFAQAVKGSRAQQLYRKPGSKEWEVLIEAGYGEPSFSVVNVSHDGKIAYVASTMNPDGSLRDTSAIYTYDLEARKLGELVFEHPKVDVAGISISERKKKPIGVGYIDAKPEVHYFDDEFAQIQNRLDATFPETINRISSIDKQESRAVVTRQSSVQPPIYYLYDIEKGTLEELAKSREWIKADQMAAMQPITLEARDGLTLHGYLTTPAGVDAKNLPLIINPHGGPWARDVYGFNQEIQFLANRGYAVLQINFRGSTGYGMRFMRAGDRQWGLKMQDDITDAVQWAIEKGIADGDRVCIYGASYGGYATMAGLAYTPDLYRCGVNYVGVTSIPLLFKTAPSTWEAGGETLRLQIGDPRRDGDMLEDRSPINHADKITAPVLMVYGEQDPRVVIDHAKQMERALKRAEKNYELIVKKNEGHGFRKHENVIEYYAKLESFFGQHLAPKSL